MDFLRIFSPVDKAGTPLMLGDMPYTDDGKQWIVRAIGIKYCYCDEFGGDRLRRQVFKDEELSLQKPDN